jgi:hypothetical protein
MTANTQHRQQIVAVIDQYRRGFTTMDVEGLTALWDQDYDQESCSGPLAMPEEGDAR